MHPSVLVLFHKASSLQTDETYLLVHENLQLFYFHQPLFHLFASKNVLAALVTVEVIFEIFDPVTSLVCAQTTDIAKYYLIQLVHVRIKTYLAAKHCFFFTLVDGISIICCE